ncbi:hypothetical protein [Bacillus massilinigeriensis]|uniref:hypothetical protein n=1 Tax=Bacillus massilionigeriensis TaxID=1805475 RepID=UPI00096B2933|nr:hypothetical protein [Bacillus massilionigeriensis]
MPLSIVNLFSRLSLIWLDFIGMSEFMFDRRVAGGLLLSCPIKVNDFHSVWWKKTGVDAREVDENGWDLRMKKEANIWLFDVGLFLFGGVIVKYKGSSVCLNMDIRDFFDLSAIFAIYPRKWSFYPR